MSGPAPVTLVSAVVMPLLLPIDYTPGAKAVLPPCRPSFLQPLLDHAKGLGSVYGFSEKKETGAPAAVPFPCRVALLLEPALQFMGDAWSAAGTGAYRFDGLNVHSRFTAVAYDHTGDKMAVIASGLIPEVLP